MQLSKPAWVALFARRTGKSTLAAEPLEAQTHDLTENEREAEA
jgi:hypothetical protein